MIAGTLIRRAYVLARVIDISDEPESYYAAEGINALNEVISSWGALGIYVPYESTLELPLIIDVKDYIIPKVIAQFLKANTTGGTTVNTVNDLRQADLKQYNLFQRNAKGTPSLVYISGEKIVFDQQTGQLGSKLTFYPTPASNFICTMTLKYILDPVLITEELDMFPPYYLKPLEYQLAKDLSLRFKTKMSDLFFQEYEEQMSNLIASNKTDMTINIFNEFATNRSFKPWGSYAR